MKKSFKIGLILLFLVGIVFTTTIEASSSLTWDSIDQTAKNFVHDGSKQTLISQDQIINAVLPIGQMLTAVGVAVLFGAIMLLGIKYMKAQPEERGKLKQQLIGLVISGIVIFGAFTIWRIAYNFFEEIF